MFLLNTRRFLRYKTICKLLNITPKKKILDIGCGREGKSFEIFNNDNYIVGIDLFPKEELKFSKSNFSYIQCNANDLSIFRDWEFDVAVSIGMFEHIGNEIERKRICHEIMRVAKNVLIVIPHKYSFIEPHFKIPLFGAFNRNLQYFLIRQFKLHSLNYRELSYENGLKKFKLSYHWLNSHEWIRFLPGFKTKPFFFGPILTDLIIYRIF